MNITKIDHFGDALIVIWCHLLRRREDRGHGIIDPDIDGAEGFLDLGSSGLDLPGVRNIGWDDERLASQRLDLAACAFQPGLAACQQTNIRSSLGEGSDDSASIACRGPRHHHYLRFFSLLHRSPSSFSY